MTNWNAQRTALAERLTAGHKHACGKIVALVDLQAFLEAVSSYRDIPARSLDEFRTLQGARAWLDSVVR